VFEGLRERPRVLPAVKSQADRLRAYGDFAAPGLRASPGREACLEVDRLKTEGELELNSKSKALAITVLIIAGIFLSLIALLAVMNRRDQTVGLNKEIKYDDFAFSVLEVARQNSLGEGADLRTAEGNYFVVTIKVANHAVRVDYKFRNGAAILVDQAGREFHLSRDGQRALESTHGYRDGCDGQIPAGASCTTQVVFDLPADARPSHVRFSEGGGIGDLLDFVFYGTKRIDLRAVPD